MIEKNMIEKIKQLEGQTTVAQVRLIAKQLGKYKAAKRLQLNLINGVFQMREKSKVNITFSKKMQMLIDEFEISLKTSKQASNKCGRLKKGYKYAKGAELIALDGVEELTLDEAQEIGAIDGLGKLTSKSKKSTYEIVNERIKELIKDKKLFWQQSWNEKVGTKDIAFPHNYITGKNYSGINLWLLAFGKGSNSYLTEKQIKERGGLLNKDAKSHYITFYVKKRIEIVKDENTGIETKSILPPTLLHYIVYNLSDTTGVKPIKHRKEIVKEFLPIEYCEKIVEKMPKKPIIRHVGNKAFYQPATDSVTMPAQTSFKGAPEYYSTLFHELIHSTGAKHRLNRIEVTATDGFGGKSYAKEELVAELGASYLCAETGILYHTRNNSAAYLRGWLSKLTDIIDGDSHFFIEAAGKAQRAANFMLSKIKKTQKKLKTEASKKSTFIAPVPTSKKKVEKKSQLQLLGSKKKNKAIGSVMTAEELSVQEFKTLPFTGAWFDFLGEPATNFKAMIFGEPGFGKTTLCLRFANYLKQFGKVLYVSSEEFGSPTLSEKIKRLNVNDVDFAKKITNINLSDYQFIFIDSVNDLKLSVDDVKNIFEKYPQKSFILILQSTKNGSFRGGQDWLHLIDIEIKGYKNENAESIAEIGKNRYLHPDSTGEFYVFG